MAVNIDDTKHGDVLLSTIQNYLELTRNGREYEACCPFHNEDKPSFSVVPDKGFYHCFGCGAHGDAIDFVSEYEGVDFKAAIKIVNGEDTMSTEAVKKRESVKKAVDPYEGIIAIMPPKNKTIKAGKKSPAIMNPKRNKETSYKPSMVFPYKNINGDLLGYVLRVDFEDGVKITPTILWCQFPDGTEGWCHYTFDFPRPLYGQEQLPGSDRHVLVVEGEKARDAANELLGDTYDVVCWHGGTQNVDKADWSVMHGRKVLLWPDMDEVGLNAMLGYEKNSNWKRGVGDLCLDSGAASVRFISYDVSKEKGWDAADALEEKWSRDVVIAWAKKFVQPFIKHEYDVTNVAPSPDTEFYEQDLSEFGNNIVPLPVEDNSDDWYNMLQRKKNDPTAIEPKTTYNGILMFRFHPDMKEVFAYNENSHTTEIISRAPWDDSRSEVPRAVNDADAVEAKSWLELQDMRLTLNDVRGCIIAAAQKRKYNPLKSYIKSLSWDNTKRLEGWLTNYMGVADSKYVRFVGKKFLIGAIARGLVPGCKMDNMLVLEGSQGVMKSTAVEILFSHKFFTDEIHNLGSKDASMQMQGKWGIEIAEMQAMNRAEINQIKEWVTRKVDRFRPPYGTTVIESKRSSVLIGTLNPEGGYLKDPTGARRFWPVFCKSVKIAELKHDRDQLWAEALHEYNQGTQWYLTPEEDEIAKDEQANRYEGDSWSDLMDTYLMGRMETTIGDTLEALDIPKAQWTKAAEMRVGKYLHTMGWGRKRLTRGGVRTYVYLHPDNKES